MNHRAFRLLSTWCAKLTDGGQRSRPESRPNALKWPLGYFQLRITCQQHSDVVCAVSSQGGLSGTTVKKY
jgi:hypothetical protein